MMHQQPIYTGPDFMSMGMTHNFWVIKVDKAIKMVIFAILHEMTAKIRISQLKTEITITIKIRQIEWK